MLVFNQVFLHESAQTFRTHRIPLVRLTGAYTVDLPPVLCHFLEDDVKALVKGFYKRLNSLKPKW